VRTDSAKQQGVETSKLDPGQPKSGKDGLFRRDDWTGGTHANARDLKKEICASLDWSPVALSY
jgi:hypothetical protein